MLITDLFIFSILLLLYLFTRLAYYLTYEHTIHSFSLPKGQVRCKFFEKLLRIIALLLTHTKAAIGIQSFFFFKKLLYYWEFNKLQYDLIFVFAFLIFFIKKSHEWRMMKTVPTQMLICDITQPHLHLETFFLNTAQQQNHDLLKCAFDKKRN